MAKCPKCGVDVRWDWQQDCYILDRKECAQIVELSVPKEIDYDKNGYDAHICKCGQLLGVMVTDDDGGHMVEIPEFKDIVWDTDEHAV